MKIGNISLSIIGMMVILVSLSACGQSINSAETSEYNELMSYNRAKKDSTFQFPLEGERSPIPEEERADFQGLKYFPVNEEYKMTATLLRVNDAKDFEMKTSTERLPVYRKFGNLKFTFNDIDFSLEIYQNVELIKKEGYEDYLFLPFTDETSGDECYGGGRYIDLRIPEGNNLIVDFNEAYNPYCNYSSNFSCPVPPPQNHIPVRIEAGELNYH